MVGRVVIACVGAQKKMKIAQIFVIAVGFGNFWRLAKSFWGEEREARGREGKETVVGRGWTQRVDGHGG